MLDSTIGQATVYRNVNKLVNSGEVKRLSSNGEIDHYDGDMSNHYHFICTSCNKIIDIFDFSIKVPISNINKNYNVTVDNFDIVLYGKCNECE